MLLIVNNNLNPYFNLALEEYLLRGLKKPVIMLWRNKKSVIIGANQNTSLEINEKFVSENDLVVARRITGGGAVFHDLGNINYTIITNKTDDIGRYDSFTSDLRAFLLTLGIESTLSGRNDILVNERKICGNAQAIKGDMLIHHGCILYSADISSLSSALKVNELKYNSKAIKSVKSRVTNLIDLIEPKITVEDFILKFKNFLKNRHNLTEYSLTDEDIANVNKLVDNKYSTYSWIYGESPSYNYKNVKKTSAGIVEINLNVEKGLIIDAKIYGDFFNKEDISKLEHSLLGLEHSRKYLKSKIKNVNEYIIGITDDEFIDLLTNND